MRTADREISLWILYYTPDKVFHYLDCLKCSSREEQVILFKEAKIIIVPIFLLDYLFSHLMITCIFLLKRMILSSVDFSFFCTLLSLKDNDKYVSFSRWFLVICHYQRVPYQRSFTYKPVSAVHNSLSLFHDAQTCHFFCVFFIYLLRSYLTTAVTYLARRIYCKFVAHLLTFNLACAIKYFN